MDSLYEVLYVSQLAERTAVTVVGNIIMKSRLRNDRDDLTGALVFDGLNFCQHLEGPFANVLACIQRIESDPRHQSFRILAQGPLAVRRFKNFSLGYAETDGMGSAIDTLRMLSGPAAIEHFLGTLPTVDLSH